MSVAGRFVRLGTQSMLAEGDSFINAERLDVVKYSTRPAESKALLDYLLYHDHNPRKRWSSPRSAPRPRTSRTGGQAHTKLTAACMCASYQCALLT